MKWLICGLFFLVSSKLSFAAKAVIDAQSLAQTVVHLNQLRTNLAQFNEYKKNFDASVNNITAGELKIEDIQNIMAGSESAIEDTIMNPSVALCDFMYPQENGQRTVANQTCKNMATGVQNGRIPKPFKDIVSGSVDVERTMNEIRKAMEEVWENLNYGELDSQGVYDLRKSTMIKAAGRNEDVFDYFTKQLKAIGQTMDDIQQNMNEIPNVSTDLQHSLEMANRQLARISMQNQQFISMVATQAMNKNSGGIMKVKEEKEKSSLQRTTISEFQKALNNDAREFNMNERYVQIRSPKYDDQ